MTRDPGGERKYKCVADCEPQPWDSCDAASTEDGGSSGGGADAASAGFIACPVPLTVRGTQTLVSFAPLAGSHKSSFSPATRGWMISRWPMIMILF